MSTTDAIQAIERFIGLCGCGYPQWCVGIAADPIERLLRGHAVPEEGDGCGWITFHCGVHELARAARDHFIDKGMKAATGDYAAIPAGNSAATAATTSTMTSVYVFRVTPGTRC